MVSDQYDNRSIFQDTEHSNELVSQPRQVCCYLYFHVKFLAFAYLYFGWNTSDSECKVEAERQCSLCFFLLLFSFLIIIIIILFSMYINK